VATDIFNFQGKYTGVVFDETSPQNFGGSIRVNIFDTRLEIYHVPPAGTLQRHVVNKEDVRPIPHVDMQKELEDADHPSKVMPDCFQLGSFGKMLFWEKPEENKACMTLWFHSLKNESGILFGPCPEQQDLFKQLVNSFEDMLQYPFVQL